MNKRPYKKEVTKKYLELREQVLNYTNKDMNLELENNKQVYIALFDIPVESNVVGFHTQTLALIFGLNTHLYFGDGSAITSLDENTSVMKSMQSLFVSCPQILDIMKLTSNIEYIESDNIRAYLKTSEGLYFKELELSQKKDKFLYSLMQNVLANISKSIS